MHPLNHCTLLIACAASLVLVSTACSTSKPKQTGDEPPASGPPKLPDHADPGPILTRDTTPLEVKHTDGPTLTADAAAQHDGVIFLRVPFPDDYDTSTLPALRNFDDNIRGMRLADHRALINFKETGEPAFDPKDDEVVGLEAPALYLRINDTDLPSTLKLRIVRFVETPRENKSDPVGHLVRRTWKLDTTEAVASTPQLAHVAPFVLGDRFAELGAATRPPADAFFSYLHRSFDNRSELRPNHYHSDDFDRQNWIEDSMSNVTGREAISETLQADRQLRSVTRNKSGSISPDDIKPLTLPEHPWSNLLSELRPEDASPVDIEPIADLAPANRMYARFDSLEAFIGMLDDAGASLAPMLGSFSNARELGDLVDRYERQLGIDASVFAKNFGDLAVDDVALLLDDPYLASGTAVTVIFKTDNPNLVNSLLDKQLADARSDLRANDSTRTIRGRQIRTVDTDNHRLSHVRTTVDGAVILSNSPAPIRAIVSTIDGDTTSIADDPGFSFMRHFYPVDGTDGQPTRTGLFYIGQDFVRRFTSPRYRIAQSRRSRAHANLQVLHYRAMFDSLLDGRWPESPDALFDSDTSPNDLSHADGSTITFDLTDGAHSEWGRPDWMRPISEVTVNGVTEAEKRAYQQFRDEYQRLGHRYIDPVAVSLTTRDGKTTFDVRVTPLHERSEYRELQGLVGRTHLSTGPDTHGLQWRFGIGEDADFRRWTRQAATSMMFGREVTVDWLGSWGAVGLSDRSGLWDAAILFDSIPVRGEDPMRAGAITDQKIKALNRFPAWIALEVKSQVGFAAFIGGVRQFLEEIAPNAIDWSKSDPYRDTDITQIEVSPRRETSTPITLLYTVTDGVFLLSPNKNTLKHRIDALKAGYTPQPSKTARHSKTSDAPQHDDTGSARQTTATSPNEAPSDSNANGDTSKEANTSETTRDEPTADGPQMALSLRTQPHQSWLRTTLFGLIENLQLYLLPGHAATHLTATQIWPSLKDDNLAERSSQWWGVDLRTHHGHLAQPASFAGLTHPLYGILPLQPRYGNPAVLQTLPDLPIEHSPVTDWLSGLQLANFHMSFEQHGQALGLHTRATFHWTTSPSPRSN